MNRPGESMARWRTPSLLVLAAFLLLVGCAHRPINPPITHADPKYGYRGLTRPMISAGQKKHGDPRLFGRRHPPVIGIGAGVLNVSPKAPNTKDITDTTAYGSLGFRTYLTDRFLMQAEYRRFVVFTSGDDDEENDEWIAGLTYFF